MVLNVNRFTIERMTEIKEKKKRRKEVRNKKGKIKGREEK